MPVSWSPGDMDRLERAIVDETRVQLRRRGTDYVVIPREIRARGGTEVLLATTTAGDAMRFALDEIESFVVLF